jgi:hypothetical protein
MYGRYLVKTLNVLYFRFLKRLLGKISLFDELNLKFVLRISGETLNARALEKIRDPKKCTELGLVSLEFE